MGCVARWSVDVVLYGGPVAMRWGNPGCVAEVGAGVIPKPSSGGVVTGVSVSVWNAPISGPLSKSHSRSISRSLAKQRRLEFGNVVSNE